METRQIATYLARARVGIGISMLLTPKLGLRTMVGPAAQASIVGPLGRIAGIRDVVLGAGGSIALGEKSGGANWLSMGAVADAVDGVVLLVSPGLVRRARLVGLAALGLAGYQLFLAKEIAASEGLGASAA
jgi:hypothetical protein